MTRGTTRARGVPFVVYVNYPGSTKEYAYWCDDHTVTQGSIVLGHNDVGCLVVRTAASDPHATRMVRVDTVQHKRERREEIMKRLAVIESFEARIARYMKLKTPEAKKLVAELRKLNS